MSLVESLPEFQRGLRYEDDNTFTVFVRIKHDEMCKKQAQSRHSTMVVIIVGAILPPDPSL